MSKLEDRKDRGLLRFLVVAENKIDFSSNDYLGFSRCPELKQLPEELRHFGATGSRLITGNSSLAEETENIIARFHGFESSLIFNSGYAANLGLFSCIAGKDDSFIADEYIHASVIDGMRLSHAARYRFAHNDVNDLEKKIQQAKGRKIVAVESVYSMEGDEAPLTEIAEVCKSHNALLIVDEAHATGIKGMKGEGLVNMQGLNNDVFACVYTFGKALGLHGAAVAGNLILRDYLINFARSFIYSTALPPVVFLQVQKAYKLLPTALRSELNALVNYFRVACGKLEKLKFIESYSPIQGIIIGDNYKAKALSDHLFEKGYFAKAILSPTVPTGTERLRICIHTFNSREEIDGLLAETNSFLS
ncbi:MAG: 8-amino-7-oxononanoate synthase [Crocinitomicaceae bacterium]|nr:8-amino-7-oxononanoate synthase [Crocinitomicaceae bacterium]